MKVTEKVDVRVVDRCGKNSPICLIDLQTRKVRKLSDAKWRNSSLPACGFSTRVGIIARCRKPSQTASVTAELEEKSNIAACSDYPLDGAQLG